MRYTALRLFAGEATVGAWYIPKRQKAYRAKSNLERTMKGPYLELRKEPFTFPEGYEMIVLCHQCGAQRRSIVFVRSCFVPMQSAQGN